MKSNRCWWEINENTLGTSEQNTLDTLETERYWGNGVVLGVCFVNPSEFLNPRQRDSKLPPKVLDQIKKNVKLWEQHANIKFNFDSAEEEADIRIVFTAKENRSCLGTECHSVAAGQPTMHLSAGAVIAMPPILLHEFGHCLSLKHEHQRSNRPFEFLIIPTLHYYRLRNSWPVQQVYDEYIWVNSASVIHHLPWSPRSIMQYEIKGSCIDS